MAQMEYWPSDRQYSISKRAEIRVGYIESLVFQVYWLRIIRPKIRDPSKNGRFVMLTKHTMNNNNTRAALSALLIAFISTSAFSQDFIWNRISSGAAKNSDGQVNINVNKATYFNFEHNQSRSDFSDSFIMEIPLADGTTSTFRLKANSTMSEGLKEKFPEIKSYNAIATDGSGYLGKVDFNSKGFHAMLLHPVENTQFVVPMYQDDNSLHIAYRKKDITTTQQMGCEAELDLKGDGLGDSKSGINYNSCELRTYRIAIAATGEYVNLQGGSVAEALAAQVTTMNRVNAIYERDFGVTMTIVPDNDELIFTNPNTDPYTNGDTFVMINENPPVLNSIIGSSNYDIGHVFGTNSGGLAGLGVTCSFNKARGVTGTFSIGDPFDAEITAHEIGHQFGASHTFNNACNGNRANETAVEPGSGSTLMAYAGICSPNVQNMADDYYHGVSMRQIGLRVNSDNCPTVAVLDNLAPVLDSVASNFFIPASTPFALTAFATDPDEEDILTYNFEQIENEISEQPPLANAIEGPNFRSFPPTTNPTQFFPRLETLTGSGIVTWQALSSIDRTMSFRCSVKDNAEGGGCAQFEDLEFDVVASAGPFIVTQPNGTGITWEAFTQEEVTWNVANTDLSPINADLVDVFLSLDGGLTYPFTLAEGIPNDGSASVIVPNASTSEARVMVMNSEGTFFDISNFDFTIEGIANGFLILAADTVQSNCVGESLVFDITIQGIGSFDEMITLSLDGDISEVDASLGDNTLLIGESTTLTVNNTTGLDPGVLDISVIGVAPSFQQSLNIEAGFNSVVPEAVTLSLPEDGAAFVSTDVLLDWESVESPDAFYTIEISTDESFQSDVLTLTSSVVSQVDVVQLSPDAVYYWRVMKETSCATGGFSEVFSFGTHSCFGFASENVPVTISAISGVYTSFLEIPFDETIQDLNVTNIEGVHGNTGQLIMTLISPSGEEVVLIDEVCAGTQDFNLGFDDSSLLDEVDCPATGGTIYKPIETLDTFIGESTQGTWTLAIADNFNGGGGSLNNWSIEVCVANSGSFILSTESDSSQLCQDQSTTFTLTSEEVFGFDDAIDLSAENVPSDMVISFDPSTINSGQSSEVTITAQAGLAPDVYFPTLIGTSADLTEESEQIVEVNSDEPENITLISPAEGSVISTLGFFEWEANSSPGAVYTLEIATDELFLNTIESVGPISEVAASIAQLPPFEALFWRVTAENGCVTSSSLPRSFSTLACESSSPADGLPLSIISIAGVYTSELVIEQAGAIQSITIPNIEGTHFRVSDLIVSLESPLGTEVVLFSSICEDEQDFNLGFSDGANSEIDCPATTGELYAPEGSFVDFSGEEAAGTWMLKVNDIQNGGGGQLDSWSLQICYEENVFSTIDGLVNNFSIFPNPTNDLVTVRSEEDRFDEVVIYDITGRKLDHIRWNGSRSMSLDFSEFAKGGYLIEIRGPFGAATKKIIRK